MGSSDKHVSTHVAMAFDIVVSWRREEKVIYVCKKEWAKETGKRKHTVKLRYETGCCCI